MRYALTFLLGGFVASSWWASAYFRQLDKGGWILCFAIVSTFVVLIIAFLMAEKEK